MRHKSSLPAGYFEAMFAADPDPWRFETSAYEAAKYDATIAALGGRRYGSALEVGCAIGVLTERLSAHSDDLLAIDVSETALAGAAARCGGSGVRFERRAFPAEAPSGGFDLIVLSEVLYYLDDGDLSAAGRWTDRALAPGGDLLLIHWIGDTDYPKSGDDAVTGFRAAVRAPLETLRAERHERYRLDLWRRP